MVRNEPNELNISKQVDWKFSIFHFRCLYFDWNHWMDIVRFYACRLLNVLMAPIETVWKVVERFHPLYSDLLPFITHSQIFTCIFCSVYTSSLEGFGLYIFDVRISCLYLSLKQNKEWTTKTWSMWIITLKEHDESRDESRLNKRHWGR